MGVREGRAGLLGQLRGLAEEKQSWLGKILGAILNTVRFYIQ